MEIKGRSAGGGSEEVTNQYLQRTRDMREELKLMVYKLNRIDATTTAAMVQRCITDLQALEFEADNFEAIDDP